MSSPDALSDAQFSAVEEAMAQTELGRGFLDEYARRNSVVRAREIMTILGDVRESLKTQSSSIHIEILRRELQEMSTSIMHTKSEIAAIKPDEPGNNRIMAATGELDVIVSATERATSDILTSAEQLQDIATKLRNDGAAAESCDEIENQVTNIFTACSFQDITGQRTTKVVNALRYIEQRVNAMIDIWGVDGVKPSKPASETLDTRPEAHLMDGPQMEGESTSQDDIDRILQEALGDSNGAGDTPAEPAPSEPGPSEMGPSEPGPSEPGPSEMGGADATQDDIDRILLDALGDLDSAEDTASEPEPSEIAAQA